MASRKTAARKTGTGSSTKGGAAAASRGVPAWRTIVASSIDWHEAHATLEEAAKNLAPELRARRPDGLPHSAWELLDHIRRTQADLVEFMSNANYRAPEWPRDYWPSPDQSPTEAEWAACLKTIKTDQSRLKRIATRSGLDLTKKIPWGDGQTYLRTVILAVDHTSYHVGQLVLVRRMLGAWG